MTWSNHPDSDRVAGELAVAIAQFAPGNDTDANLATMAELTARAVARGARLIVFPEYSSFYDEPLGPSYAAASQSVDGPFVAELGALALSLDIFIVAGLVERVADPDKFANTLVALDPTGTLVARYGKQHLYDAFGSRESDWVVSAGTPEPQLFTVDGFAVGLQTCYDLRFPEVTRRLVDAGAEVVLVPADWVRGPLKEHHWKTLATSRAIENTIYLAAADQIPPHGVGLSLIVDPMGVVIAELGEREDIAVATFSLQRIADVRRTNPSLALRRYRVVPR